MGIFNKLYESSKLGRIFKSNYVLLITLTIIVISIAYYRILIQIEVGPIWDTFDFLSNAIYFAGQGFGYVDLTRPPVMPFLASIFFRLGFISEVPIYILDAIFYVLGVLGLYFLFKLRFNPLESFLGSLLFATFPVVLFFTGLGLSDVPSLSFSIWAIYLTVLAIRRNSKYFYLSFLLAMLAFLSRYPAGLIVLPIFTYLVINRTMVNYRDMTFGILLSSVPLLLTLVFFFYTFNSPFYPFGLFYGSSQSSFLPILNYYYFPDFFYFIKNIPYYIGSAGITIIAFIILGALILGFRGRKILNANLKKLGNLTPKKYVNRINILFLFLLMVFLLSLNEIPWMVSEILFVALGLTIFFALRRIELKHLDMDILFLVWFMAFFIFHSVYVIKDDRYFLTMVPAISYFLVLGFSKVSKSLDIKRSFKFTSFLLATVLILIMLISAFSYLPGIPQHESLEKEAATDSKLSSEWLMNHDPKYKSQIVYADLGPYFSWYLKMNVKTMPVFMNGQTYEYQIKGYNITNKDLQAYNNELVQNNASYYLSIRSGLNLADYQAVNQFGFITIYRRI